MPNLVGKRVGGGGSLTGANPRGYSPSFGGIPTIPSPGATASAALGSNIGNLPAITTLGGGINRFNTSQALEQIGMGLPDYAAMVDQSSKNIGSELKGELPGDVIDQILQQAAERGIATGTNGSPSNNAAFLRALGLTSLNLQQVGEGALTGAIARTPRPPLFDPMAFLVSPAAFQEAQTGANYMAAAPVPSAAAGAALGVARSGVREGVGSVSAPRFPFNPFAPQGYSTNPFAPSVPYNPPEVVGGPLGTPPETAAEIATNWNEWAGSLPRSAGRGTGTITDAEGIPTSYVPGEFGSFFEDMG